MSNSNVKKVYIPLIELLEANKNKSIKTLMPEILALTQSKTQAKTYRVNENGEVTHVFCYYHKLWEDVSIAEYGAKAKTASGLNTMCKEGLSNWSKQQRDYKKAKSQILDQVVAGTLSADKVEDTLHDLEQAKDQIVLREDGHGEAE